MLYFRKKSVRITKVRRAMRHFSKYVHQIISRRVMPSQRQLRWEPFYQGLHARASLRLHEIMNIRSQLPLRKKFTLVSHFLGTFQLPAIFFYHDGLTLNLYLRLK